MKMTIESVYEKYAAYVNALHRDLDAIRDGGISERYRAKLLSFEGFSAMWERWSRQDGLQERWLRRFTAGYERDVAEMRERLAEALGTPATERPGADQDKVAA